MESVLEYIARKHCNLKDSYSTSEGYQESCLLIAIEIARMLLAEGNIPSIVGIRGELMTEGTIIANQNLIPRIYTGVAWGMHSFCYHDGLVYDPILKEPVPILEYILEVFGEGNFQIRVQVTSERIREFVQE